MQIKQSRSWMNKNKYEIGTGKKADIIHYFKIDLINYLLLLLL